MCIKDGLSTSPILGWDSEKTMIQSKIFIINVSFIVSILFLERSVKSDTVLNPNRNDEILISQTNARYIHPTHVSATDEPSVIRGYPLDKNASANSMLSFALTSARVVELNQHFERTGRFNQATLIDYYRQNSRNALDHSSLFEISPRRFTNNNFDSNFDSRQSVNLLRKQIVSNRLIRRDAYSHSRHLELLPNLINLNNRNERLSIQNSLSTKYTKGRELNKNLDRVRRRMGPSIRNREMRERQLSRNRISYPNFVTSIVAPSFLTSPLVQYLSSSYSVLNVKLYPINDLIASAITGVLLYDFIGVMTQGKAVMKNKPILKLLEKLLSVPAKVVAY